MNRDRGYSPHNGISSNTVQMATGANLKQATLNEIWDDLKSGIESVYSQQTMSKPRYMTLYSYVLNSKRKTYDLILNLLYFLFFKVLFIITAQAQVLSRQLTRKRSVHLHLLINLELQTQRKLTLVYLQRASRVVIRILINQKALK